MVAVTEELKGTLEAALEPDSAPALVGPSICLRRRDMFKHFRGYIVILFAARQEVRHMLFWKVKTSIKRKISDDKALWTKLQVLIAESPDDVSDFEYGAY